MSGGDAPGTAPDAGPDPAALAAAEPEPAPPPGTGSGDDPVYAIGIGPGAPEYLTPRGARALREADVVVGFETVVGFVREETDAELLTCGYSDEAGTLAAFADRVADGAAGVAVLMGDPNHSGYQFLGKVGAAVDAPVRVIPGISALQVAASRARTPMEATTFVTLHRRGDVTPDLRRLREHVGERHLLVLPRPYDLMPEDVAADLLEAGADPTLDALVFERLTHPDEAVTRTTLGALGARAAATPPTTDPDTAPDGTADGSPFSDLSVLAVRADGGAGGSGTGGLPR